MQQQDIHRYCGLMEEIKQRTAVVGAFGDGRTPTLYKATTIESVYLQFRKILELIALGSLVANKTEFSKAHVDFAKHWNARRILHDLTRINRSFYPQPIIEVPSQKPNTKMDLRVKKKGFLTKEDFVKLYAECGAIVHAPNPYGKQVDYEYYGRNILMWLKKIIALMGVHTIRLLNDPNLYLIHMRDGKDERVWHYVLAPKTVSTPAV